MELGLGNREIIFALNDFIESIPDGYDYFVIGSAALASYLSKSEDNLGIRDIDIIASSNGFEDVKKKLIEKGYTQGTFIGKDVPFHRQLSWLARRKYYRFEKGNGAIEIHTAIFSHQIESLVVRLYPGISVSFPQDSIVRTSLNNIEFMAASSELLYIIYKLGPELRKGYAQKREGRLQKLSELIDKARVKKVVENAFIYLGPFRARIPRRFIS